MLLPVPRRPAELRSGGLRADRLHRQAGIGVRRQRRRAVEGPGGDHRGGAQGAGRRAVRHGGRQHADAPVDRALRHPEQDQADARAVSRHRPAGHRPAGRPRQARHVEPDQRRASISQSGKLKAYGMAAPERAAVGARHHDLQGAGLRRRRRHHRLHADRAARHAGRRRRQAQRGAERRGGDAGDARGPAQARLRRHGRHAARSSPNGRRCRRRIWGPVLQAAGIKPE